MSDDFDDGSSAATGDSELDPERRAALRALATYSGSLGAAATLTVLSAEDVLAQNTKDCSFPPNNTSDKAGGKNCWDDEEGSAGTGGSPPGAGGGKGGGRSAAPTMQTFGSDADTVIFGAEPDSVTDPDAGWIRGDG